MIQSTPTDGNFGQYLICFLHDQRQKKANVNVRISGGCYDGSLQLRDGEIVSATAGSLSGNGAVMTLAMMEKAQLASSLDSSSLPKTVYLTPDQIEKLLAVVKKGPAGMQLGQEEQLLAQAKQMFFQYRYKEAGEKISAVLRTNRFFYPAWLWQSRLVRKPAFILKAIDEAYRWGNHDREIWREARKLRPQLVSNQAETSQRCFFCWSLVDEAGQCTHCRTRLIISEHGSTEEVLADEIKQTVGEFERAYKQDPQNGRVAYSLAVGYFHLGMMRKALQFLQAAVRISPRSVVFRKSLNALGVILKAEKQQRPQTAAAVPGAATPPAKAVTAREQSPRAALQPVAQLSEDKPAPVAEPAAGTAANSIFIIEDSPTSRKVLSMVLGRNGFTVVEATTGAEALQLAATIKPALVLLDVMLPDMTGYDVLPKLREMPHYRELPVVMLTGRKGSEDRMRGMMLGTNEYLTKPFNPEKLISVIKNYV